MAKTKQPKDHDAAVAAMEKATEARKAAKAKMDEFLEKNELRKTVNHTGKLDDKKKQAAYDKLRGAWEKAKEAEKEAKKTEKSMRPKKERKTKYNYPSDCVTADDRKKFRAGCRAAAKRAGVEVDEYLSDPEKYDKQVEEKKAEKKASKKSSKKSEKKADKKTSKKSTKKGKSKKKAD